MACKHVRCLIPLDRFSEHDATSELLLYLANAGEVLGRTLARDHCDCVAAQQLMSLSPKPTLVNVRQLDPVGDLVVAARDDRLSWCREAIEGGAVSRGLDEDRAIRFSNEVKGGRHLAGDDYCPTSGQRHRVHATGVDPPFPALRALDDRRDRVGHIAIARCIRRNTSGVWRITRRIATDA